jgi:calcium/calmodulin-dependent protein kinase I/calcium-dependent protein kinase
MEYVNGGTLKNKMEKSTISLKQAVGFMQDIFEGLGYLHSLGLVHRDIKPSNIMFSIEKNRMTGRLAETLKIIDYGLIGNLTDKTEDSLIHDKCGTLGYLAPELLGKKDNHTFYDDKVDVFSAGILFFEM